MLFSELIRVITAIFSMPIGITLVIAFVLVVAFVIAYRITSSIEGDLMLGGIVTAVVVFTSSLTPRGDELLMFAIGLAVMGGAGRTVYERLTRR
jgi:hypothetical protein